MKKILSLFILLFLVSCNDGKMTFLKLEKHSGEGIFDRDSIQGKKFIYESYLVNRSLSDSVELKSLMLNFNKKNYLKALSNKNTIQYSLQFYEKNATTEYFIDHDDDPGGFSSEILTDYFVKEGIAEIYINKIDDKKCYREIKLSNQEEYRIIDTIAID